LNRFFAIYGAGTGVGIEAWGGPYTKIFRNAFYNNPYGILFIWPSANWDIINNDFTVTGLRYMIMGLIILESIIISFYRINVVY